jgi:hypothetical protein
MTFVLKKSFLSQRSFPFSFSLSLTKILECCEDEDHDVYLFSHCWRLSLA